MIVEKLFAYGHNLSIYSSINFGAGGGNRTRFLALGRLHNSRYTTPATGAEDGTRTHDLLVTNELLYQLSYFGVLILG